MELPNWALSKATALDWESAKKAYHSRTAKIVLRHPESLRSWMKGKGWKRPWLFLEESFMKQLFASDENYRLVLREYVADIRIPKKNVVISEEDLQSMDEDYAARSYSGLVEGLREIRRVIEAGTEVEIDGKKLKSFNSFYTWAHARYHLLEEGSDKWIGDDR